MQLSNTSVEVKKIDLHIHTCHSDDKNTPAEIIKKAKEIGISIISITDHDTIDGLKEAFDVGVKYGVQVISGIEFTIESKENIHILGYDFNVKNKKFMKLVKELSNNRFKELVMFLRKLSNNGIHINVDEIVKKNGNINARSISDYLISYGYATNMSDVDDIYFNRGGIAYVEKYKITAKQAIETIVSAGGVAVLAHPVRYNLSLLKLEELVKEYITYGLDAIEVFHTDQYKIDSYIDLAKKYNLKMTGGSDFHSDTKSALGKCSKNQWIPFSVYKGLTNY